MNDQVEKTIVVIGAYFKIVKTVSMYWKNFVAIFEKLILDPKTSSASKYVKEVSTSAKVEEIGNLLPNLLPKTKATLIFYNRCASVDDQDSIGEAFHYEDPVTVWVGAPQTTEEKERGSLKNISNNSKYEIVVLARTKDGWPIFFEGKQLQAVKFDSFVWSKKIVIYR